MLDTLFPYRDFGQRPTIDAKEEHIEEITSLQVKRALKGKKSRSTAPGPDGIGREIWKEIPEELINYIRDTYNLSLKSGLFPAAWKKSTLILIPKGNTNLSFRPICLIDDIGKGFERILVERMLEYMEKHPRAALSDRQFGFRRGRSAVDAILQVREAIEEAISDKQCLLAVSLDIRNAFNSLSWDSILQALSKKGFPVYIRKLVSSYLSDRLVYCRDSSGKVISRGCYAGVPQGSVLGPLLWSITYDFVLETPLSFESSLIGYADDTILLIRADSALRATFRANMDLASILLRTRELGLEVAPQKTQIVLFQRRMTSNSGLVEVRIDDEYIQARDSMKYLGVTLDYKLSFRPHFKSMEEKGNNMMRALMRVLPNLRGPGEAKRQLYVNIVHAAMLYAAPVWSRNFNMYKVNQGPILKIQKLLALRTICAYRSVSWEAATLLARIPPFGLLAERQRRLYFRAREYREDGTLTSERKTQLIEMANVILHRQWGLFIQGKRYGRRTREAILPVFDEWMCRGHGGLSFHLTQLLTGHGSFAEFTYIIKKSPSPRCNFCGDDKIDSAEHTIFECPRWSMERSNLDQRVIEERRLDLLVRDIVRRSQAWSALATFAREVLTRKEAAEREQERRVLTGRPTYEDSDDEDWAPSHSSQEVFSTTSTPSSDSVDFSTCGDGEERSVS